MDLLTKIKLTVKLEEDAEQIIIINFENGYEIAYPRSLNFKAIIANSVEYVKNLFPEEKAHITNINIEVK